MLFGKVAKNDWAGGVALGTIIYPARELDACRRWYSQLLGVEPYFDEPFYVGFNVGGYELGLDPNAEPGDGPVTCWGVADADAALAWLLERGAVARGAVNDVGDGIRVATVLDPAGSPFGIIENPHFLLGQAPSGEGPGR
jgi:catechol 2,3-dioxygenase-like lactoylglutathione lyase family enzyme